MEFSPYIRGDYKVPCAVINNFNSTIASRKIRMILPSVDLTWVRMERLKRRE
jgi:hypothetical protein